MIDPVTGSLIAGGLGAITNTASQVWLNKQNQKFAREAMQTQRNWANEDWEKVNAYNTPSQQMQRLKEAGLNPQLIYGNVNNSPSAMVRSTDIKTPNIGNDGFIAASNSITDGVRQAQNAYFANKALENDTQLKQAQVLNLKSQSDKTALQNKITSEAFQDLVMKQWYDNQLKNSAAEKNYQGTLYLEQQRNNLPTQDMAFERYLAETAKVDAQARHAQELYNLAKQEGILKEADIKMLEMMSASPKGLQYVVEFLKILTGNATRKSK